MTTELNSARSEAGASQAMTTAAAPPGGTFVINLCSSTTPMALRIPEVPELRRFAFFVSRRREEGRERFRLHMGHFASLAEAEEWLGIVRELYPGAWAGEAPGKKLRAAQEAAAAAAAAAAQATAAPVGAAVVPADVAPTPPPRTAPRVAAPPPAVPPAPRAAAPVPRRAAAAAVRSRADTVPPARPPSPAAYWPSAGGRARREAPRAAPPPAPPADGIPVVQAARFAAAPVSRVGVKPAPAAVPSPPPPRAKSGAGTGSPPATAPAAPAAPAVASRPPRETAAAPPVPTAGVVQSNLRQVLADLDGEDAALSDTQVLRMLERRRDAAAAARAPSAPLVGAPEEIQLLRPDDVSTMTELRRGLTANEQLFFAVQLEWSVRPIELKRVPPLAIFSAYTLYTVEGNREGRTWFGLRLGFFSDSISAKQVALYVRSEFKSVAVIPVSGREKHRATEDGRLSPSALGHAQHKEKPPEEFKLIDSTGERPALPAAAVNPPAAAAAPAAREAAPAKGPPAKPPRPLPGVRRSGRKKTVEESLEETLEILGASELSLDDGRKPLINDTGVRPSLSSETGGGTGTFAKLLERLSDRLVRGR